jgi:drug/metabolite transporter (DMT)-like permease
MNPKNVFQYILGAMIVIGFFVLMYLLLAQAVPEQNKDILNIVVGALIGSFTSIVGYFYGSSLGSADKNDLLRK